MQLSLLCLDAAIITLGWHLKSRFLPWSLGAGGRWEECCGKTRLCCVLICLKSSVHARVHQNALGVASQSILPSVCLITINPEPLFPAWPTSTTSDSLPRSWESVATADCRWGGVKSRGWKVGARGLGPVCVDAEAASGYFFPALPFNLLSGLARKGVESQRVKPDCRDSG